MGSSKKGLKGGDGTRTRKRIPDGGKTEGRNSDINDWSALRTKS